MTMVGYMYIEECEKKENRIAECTKENKLLSGKLEDTKFDLSVATKEIEQRDEIVAKMQVVINDLATKEDKLSKINELVKIYQDIN